MESSGCSFCVNAACDGVLTPENDLSYMSIGCAADGFSVFLRSGGGRSTQILFEQRSGRFWGLRAFYYPKFCPECGRRLTENCDDK